MSTKKLQIIGSITSQADWTQSDETAVDYIKNRTHYCSVNESYSTDTVGDFTLGVTLMKDLSSVYSAYLKYYTYEYLTNRDNSLTLGYTAEYKLTAGYRENGTKEMTLASSKCEKIDDTNWKFILHAAKGYNIYFITSLDTLAEEYQELFPTIGVYLQCTNETTLADMRNLRVIMYSWGRLNERYMPTNVLFDEDKEELQANIDALIPTNDSALDLVTEMGLIDPVAADDGSIYTDENNVLYSL